jgi:hypothetical protein
MLWVIILATGSERVCMSETAGEVWRVFISAYSVRPEHRLLVASVFNIRRVGPGTLDIGKDQSN